MEIWILFGMFFLCILGAIQAVKIYELQEAQKKFQQKLDEFQENEPGDDFEELYKRGLAGIMAYSLKEAEGADEL